MLETEIKKLSAQIEQLNSNFEKFFNAATLEAQTEPKAEPKAEAQTEPKAEPKAEAQTEPKAEPKAEAQTEPKAEPKAEPEAQPEAQPEPGITGDDVRQLCLEKSRENKENKAKIKAILSDLGAKLVSDLNEEGLVIARNKIGAL